MAITNQILSKVEKSRNEMRKKGHEKTGGRTKGTPNKSTMETREWIQAIVDKSRPQLEKDLEVLESKERWQVIERLLQYITPKMQSVEAKVDLNNLTDAQLDTLISELTRNL